MTYYGNRGMAFEDFIIFANRRYRERGDAIIEKQHTAFKPIRDRTGRIVSCKVEEKATVDFMGRVYDIPIAIEAKYTKDASIRWDAVQDHQARFLTDFCAKGKGISLVIVSFNLERFYAVPWAFWKEARDAWKEAQKQGKKKAAMNTVWKGPHKWTTNGKASVKADELLPGWEIKMGGRIGLDYLRNYMVEPTIEIVDIISPLPKG